MSFDPQDRTQVEAALRDGVCQRCRVGVHFDEPSQGPCVCPCHRPATYKMMMALVQAMWTQLNLQHYENAVLLLDRFCDY